MSITRFTMVELQPGKLAQTNVVCPKDPQRPAVFTKEVANSRGEIVQLSGTIHEWREWLAETGLEVAGAEVEIASDPIFRLGAKVAV